MYIYPRGGLAMKMRRAVIQPVFQIHFSPRLHTARDSLGAIFIHFVLFRNLRMQNAPTHTHTRRPEGFLRAA